MVFPSTHNFFHDNTFFLKKEPVLKLFCKQKPLLKNIRFFDQTFFGKAFLSKKRFVLKEKMPLNKKNMVQVHGGAKASAEAGRYISTNILYILKLNTNGIVKK
jgi:hypothetical protein